MVATLKRPPPARRTNDVCWLLRLSVFRETPHDLKPQYFISKG
jgi:hypothetical protein